MTNEEVMSRFLRRESGKNAVLETDGVLLLSEGQLLAWREALTSDESVVAVARVSTSVRAARHLCALRRLVKEKRGEIGA